MSKRTLTDPIANWPKPVGSMSSLELAANALWKRAESRTWRGEGDPMWLLDGALAYTLDMAEDIRRRHRLPLDLTPQDILPFITAPSMAEIEAANPGRARFIVQLLTYAIDADIEREQAAIAPAVKAST